MSCGNKCIYDTEFDEYIYMDEDICECCQGKTDTIESFLAEYMFYANREELTLENFFEILEDLYDNAYQNGRVDALEELSESALVMAYGTGYDDLS